MPSGPGGDKAQEVKKSRDLSVVTLAERASLSWSVEAGGRGRVITEGRSLAPLGEGTALPGPLPRAGREAAVDGGVRGGTATPAGARGQRPLHFLQPPATPCTVSSTL